MQVASLFKSPKKPSSYTKTSTVSQTATPLSHSALDLQDGKDATFIAQFTPKNSIKKAHNLSSVKGPKDIKFSPCTVKPKKFGLLD
jgi:hypothetical protein